MKVKAESLRKKKNQLFSGNNELTNELDNFIKFDEKIKQTLGIRNQEFSNTK